MTWHPTWKALVDGKPVKTVMLSPDFTGLPVVPDQQRILCRYEPGSWKVVAGLRGAVLRCDAGRRGALRISARRMPRDVVIFLSRGGSQCAPVWARQGRPRSTSKT